MYEGYILVTLTKNEEKNLPHVAESVINQTIRPGLWLIFDDGSTDKTPQIISELTESYKWIVAIFSQSTRKSRDRLWHLSYIARNAIEHTVAIAKRRHIKFNYIGILDADNILEPTYFEKLINEFQKDSKLGIATGTGYYYDDNGHLKKRKVLVPGGSPRLIRKQCYFDIGGYSLDPSPDSISNIKAINRGWKVKVFEKPYFILLRDTGAASGFWKGYQEKGISSYYLNVPITFAIANMILESLKRPHYRGIAYIYGYLNAVLQKISKTKDKEIFEYYGNKKLLNSLYQYIDLQRFGANR